jgi:HlyD family secretion protein
VDKSASLTEQIQTAQDNVATLEGKVASLQVDSTLRGKVLEVDVKKGQTVAAGGNAVIVADTDNMEVYSTVSSKDVKSLRDGMDVDIFSADGDRKYPGVISRIGQEVISADGEGSENMTDLVISPKDGLDELPGSSIDLEVVLSQKKGVEIISLDCLTTDGSVFVVDGQNRVHKTVVQKGLQDDYNVEITGGLSEGQSLVLNPDKNLKDGQKVTVID